MVCFTVTSRGSCNLHSAPRPALTSVRSVILKKVKFTLKRRLTWTELPLTSNSSPRTPTWSPCSRAERPDGKTSGDTKLVVFGHQRETAESHRLLVSEEPWPQRCRFPASFLFPLTLIRFNKMKSDWLRCGVRREVWLMAAIFVVWGGERSDEKCRELIKELLVILSDRCCSVCFFYSLCSLLDFLSPL